MAAVREGGTRARAITPRQTRTDGAPVNGDTWPMAKVFCIANQKGGVGKTTTTVNLAAGLVRAEQRVLVIDLDPQGNATMGSGIDKRAMPLSVYDVLLESASIGEARQHSDKGGYDVLGANRELAGAEVELVALEHRNERDRKSTRLNSSHNPASRMPSSA
jgi:cellulose biosynthesis protein BcsQ